MRKLNTYLKKFSHSSFVDGALHLIYPETCLICENELSKAETVFCFTCHSTLHYTYFENLSEPSELDRLFWGRIQVHSTYSYLYYEKTNSSQPLLKALKYNHRADVGRKFGALIGKKIADLEQFKTIDVLIPVPIHPKKEFIRGYNQSKMIAEGISEITKIPMILNFLTRIEHSKSQTTLGRFNRWDNVEGKFQVIGNTAPKHIALIDDVITTGSTLEAIIKLIHEKFPAVQISVISLALTK